MLLWRDVLRCHIQRAVLECLIRNANNPLRSNGLAPPTTALPVPFFIGGLRLQNDLGQTQHPKKASRHVRILVEFIDLVFVGIFLKNIEHSYRAAPAKFIGTVLIHDNICAKRGRGVRLSIKHQ